MLFSSTNPHSKRRYPSGRTVSYGYDGLDRVITLQQKAPGAAAFSSVVNAVNYDDWGALSKITFASLAQSQWTSDALGNQVSRLPVLARLIFPKI